MTRGEIDKVLEEMVTKFGLEMVREHMADLIGKVSWEDWQRLDSWLTNATNRIERA